VEVEIMAGECNNRTPGACVTGGWLKEEISKAEERNDDAHERIREDMKEIYKKLEAHAIDIAKGKILIAVLATLGAIVGGFIAKFF
jgi:uncharacterized protein (UPF0335 family)